MSITRISRRLRTYGDIGYKDSGGINDLFDNEIKSIYRLNDAEYDYLCENITQGDSNVLLEDAHTFTEKRDIIIRINKYTKLYNDELSTSTNC